MDKKAHALRRLVTHIGQQLNSDLYVRLWTGEVLTFGAPAPGNVGVAVKHASAISRLLHSPRLSTLFELMALGEIEIEGGTLLDLAARRGKVRSRAVFAALNKRILVRALAPFLFARGSSTRALAAAGGVASTASGRAAHSIRFHYDISNEFYELILDPEMQYSSAYFAQAHFGLDQAQRAKLDLICTKLRLRPGDRFLDVGCGWGGLICFAAQNYGVIAHGVTLSSAQLAYAQEKIDRLGLNPTVTIQLGDYRSVEGVFDKIASIEMFEHLGIANHKTYFKKINKLLRPRGIYVHQGSARPAKSFKSRSSEYDVVTKYIFPGGELDYIGLTLKNMESLGFEVHDVLALREHMTRTFRFWLAKLYQKRLQAVAMVGEITVRKWLLYLAGCAMAFDRGGAVVFQTLATKRARGASEIPLSRAELYSQAAPPNRE